MLKMVSPNEIKTIFRAIDKNNAKYLPRLKNSSSSNIFPSKEVNHFNQCQIVHWIELLDSYSI